MIYAADSRRPWHYELSYVRDRATGYVAEAVVCLEGPGLAPVRVADTEHTAVVDPRVSVDDSEDHFGVELPEGEVDSVGGFILDQLGYLPAAGEQLSWRDLHFTVEAVSENRIQRVRIMRAPEEAEDEEGDEPAD